MSRTIKKEPFHYYRKEPTCTRRWSIRRYRAQCKNLLRNGNYDIPAFRKTEGWLYW
jgi:hypothetical protein